MDVRETVELTGITAEEPTEYDLVEISASELVPDDKEEAREKAVPENRLTLGNLAEGFQLLSLLLTSFTAWTFL